MLTMPPYEKSYVTDKEMYQSKKEMKEWHNDRHELNIIQFTLRLRFGFVRNKRTKWYPDYDIPGTPTNANILKNNYCFELRNKKH